MKWKGWEAVRAKENMPYGIIQQQIMQVEICVAVVFISTNLLLFRVIFINIPGYFMLIKKENDTFSRSVK